MSTYTYEQVCGALAYAEMTINLEDAGNGQYFLVTPIGAGKPCNAAIAKQALRELRVKTAIRTLNPGLTPSQIVSTKDAVMYHYSPEKQLNNVILNTMNYHVTEKA